MRKFFLTLSMGLFLLAGLGCSNSKSDKKEDQGVIPPTKPAPIDPNPPGTVPPR